MIVFWKFQVMVGKSITLVLISQDDFLLCACVESTHARSLGSFVRGRVYL